MQTRFSVLVITIDQRSSIDDHDCKKDESECYAVFIDKCQSLEKASNS